MRIRKRKSLFVDGVSESFQGVPHKRKNKKRCVLSVLFFV